MNASFSRFYMVINVVLEYDRREQFVQMVIFLVDIQFDCCSEAICMLISSDIRFKQGIIDKFPLQTVLNMSCNLIFILW